MAYPPLASLAKTDTAKQRICIVTPDLLGAVKNGGIGTACANLAYGLAAAGHDLSVLFCKVDAEEMSDKWLESYNNKGIKVTNAAIWQKEQGAQPYFPDLPQLAMARTVYEWLKNQPEFDLILFVEWQGAGFYTMHAKRSGRAFKNTALVVNLYSPSYWHAIYNMTVPSNPVAACIWHMERETISMADAVMSSSQYMLAWTNERVCKLPAHSYWQPDLLVLEDGLKNVANAPIEEAVFFGRLEFRKGLEQFCSALDRLAKRGQLPKKVTFLGKCSWLENEHSAIYIARRSKKWRGCEISLETEKGHREAVEYICQPGRIAIMPSISDNSPFTVHECLLSGTPFLARNVGGIGEFLPESQRTELLFNDNPADLAEKLAAALGKPPKRGTLAFDPIKNARAWQNGLPALADLVRSCGSESQKAQPFISVVLSHYNRPQYLRQAVNSFFEQDSDGFEVILVDDGSDTAAALKLLDELEPQFKARDWKILRQKNSYLGAARNNGAKIARGEWLLFFDDDNVAMPHLISAAKEAAARQKSGLIAFMFQVFEGQNKPTRRDYREVFLPTGNEIAYSAFQNTLADATSLVNKDSFFKAGCFTEDYGIGHEDYELYLRLALAGEPAAIIPEPLFWYRKSKRNASMLVNTNAALNRMRSLRPFLEMLPPPLAEMALMTHSLGQRLNLYGEAASNSWLDLPLDRRAEPDSPAVMVQVANILAALGQDNLATGILTSLPPDEQPIQLSLICARAGAAARRGDLQGIQQAINDFDALDLNPAEIASVFAAALDDLTLPAKNLRRDMIRRLKALPKRNFLASLLLADHVASDGKLDEASRYYIEALVFADLEYQKNRPDVGEAVKAKGFICGLQHFALHGIIDETPWPERKRFAAILEKYPNLLPYAETAHKLAWRYDEPELSRQMFACLSSSLQ